jgi:hypothetical protein
MIPLPYLRRHLASRALVVIVSGSMVDLIEIEFFFFFPFQRTGAQAIYPEKKRVLLDYMDALPSLFLASARARFVIQMPGSDPT